MQFYAWGPENRTVNHFLEQIIQQNLPADLDHLPVVKNKNFPQYIGWMRNPIGMRYVEMVKIFKPEMKSTP